MRTTSNSNIMELRGLKLNWDFWEGHGVRMEHVCVWTCSGDGRWRSAGAPKSVAVILDVHLMALQMSKKTINHISESVRTFPETIRTWGHWLNVLIHRWIHTLNRLSIGGRTVETEPGWRKPVGVALGAVSYPGPFFLHSAMLVGRYSIKGSVLLHPPRYGGKLWNHELKPIFPLLCFFTELTTARNYQTHALGSTDKDGDDGTILLVSLAEKASLNRSGFKGRWQVCRFHCWRTSA